MTFALRIDGLSKSFGTTTALRSLSLDVAVGEVLAASGVRRLVSREPSLEELFVAHYGANPSGAMPDAA